MQMKFVLGKTLATNTGAVFIKDNKMRLNGQNVVDVEIDGVDPHDYPDFCDAYFSYATFEGSAQPLSDEELEQLTNENGDVLHEMAYEHFID
jgi:hypothetical protein